MKPVHEMGVAELGRALADRELSSVEATGALLERLSAHAALGTVLASDRDAALQQAKAADARRAAGESGALLGVPIAHKDIFVSAGLPTTAGSKMLEGYRSPFDATVVARLAEAGTVTLAKLNCDEFAMGSSNENSAYGVVRNPWDTGRVPGGSSGGSAAAVAARLVPAATGTDTGGSIRQPASFTGITGIKPTYGVCSRYGMVAFASSLDQAGPMARSAADCALLLSAMSGFDPRDATSAERPPQDFSAQMHAPRDGASPRRRHDARPRDHARRAEAQLVRALVQSLRAVDLARPMIRPGQLLQWPETHQRQSFAAQLAPLLRNAPHGTANSRSGACTRPNQERPSSILQPPIPQPRSALRTPNSSPTWTGQTRIRDRCAAPRPNADWLDQSPRNSRSRPLGKTKIGHRSGTSRPPWKNDESIRPSWKVVPK